MWDFFEQFYSYSARFLNTAQRFYKVQIYYILPHIDSRATGNLIVQLASISMESPKTLPIANIPAKYQDYMNQIPIIIPRSDFLPNLIVSNSHPVR